MQSKIKVAYGQARRNTIGTKFDELNKPNVEPIVKENIESGTYA